ncbi:MAG: hypothetical protein M3416_01340 [Acidobacteriota bacterium]|nr:hypothetical protein [Acidobacteriota bacterium]
MSDDPSIFAYEIHAKAYGREPHPLRPFPSVTGPIIWEGLNARFTVEARSAADALVQAQVGLEAQYEDGHLYSYRITGVRPA